MAGPAQPALAILPISAAMAEASKTKGSSACVRPQTCLSWPRLRQRTTQMRVSRVAISSIDTPPICYSGGSCEIPSPRLLSFFYCNRSVQPPTCIEGPWNTCNGEPAPARDALGRPTSNIHSPLQESFWVTSLDGCKLAFTTFCAACVITRSQGSGIGSRE